MGALVNGVFLVALCLSIFLDAIGRFVEPQEVSNPLLVLGVGCWGLTSNIVGLLLFHDLGHSHGGDHGHGHGEESLAEQGQGDIQTRGVGGHTQAVADESGNIADVLPQATIAGWPKSNSLSQPTREESSEVSRKTSKGFTASDEDVSTVAASTLNRTKSPLSSRKSTTNNIRASRRLGSGSHSGWRSVDGISGHPASFRKDIIAASRMKNIDSDNGSDSDTETAIADDHQEASEETPLLGSAKPNRAPKHSRHNSQAPKQNADAMHKDHHHNQAQEASGGVGRGHGHSHSDLNMRGVFLHVMGDALGNIGVIGSAYIIWLTTVPWRFYADPAISLMITVVILCSAVPLCKAASRILLQAVPPHINVDEIKEDIERLPGIISCHHLHVWQLSDVKPVASLHVQMELDLKGEGSARYMELARAISRCLHGFGIHSSTIQPEFCLDSEHRHTSAATWDCEDAGNPDNARLSKLASKRGSKAPSLQQEADACLLECSDECGASGQCCAPAAANTDADSDSH